MSLDAFSHARTAGFAIDPFIRLALLALADAADPDGLVRDVRREQIANWSWMRMIDARAALQSLQEHGYIYADPVLAPGEYQSTVVPGWEQWLPNSGEGTADTPWWMILEAHNRAGGKCFRCG